MSTDSKSSFFSSIDKQIFIPSATSLLVMILAIIFLPDMSNKILGALQQGIVKHMSWFIMLLVACNFFLCVWIALSRYGNIVLGATEEDTIEFSTMTWLAMLFSAGVGIGFICFGVAEPMWHQYTSTHTVIAKTAGTPAAVPMGIQISVSDWGASCWALFAMGGLAIALPAYKKNMPMTVSTGLYGIMGDKVLTSKWAKLADVLGIIASVAGNSAALGMGVLSIATAMNRIFAVEVTSGWLLGIMGFIMLVYIICTATGLDRGIKYMSNANVIVAGLLALFVLLTGPTTYILNLFTEVTGLYVSEFVTMNFFTHAGALMPDEWLHWWPIFYWLWWISYIPFIGGFVARISRGRSLRQYLLGVCFMPVGLSLVWFTVFGGAASWAQFVDGVKIWETMQAQGSEPAIYMLLESYPLGTLACVAAMLSLITFTVTTSNSAAFFLGMQVNFGARNPTNAALMLWGTILGGVGIGVTLIGGDASMQALKALTVAGSAPFCIILLLYMVSVVKMIQRIDKNEF